MLDDFKNIPRYIVHKNYEIADKTYLNIGKWKIFMDRESQI